MVNPARGHKDTREPKLPALVSQSLHSPLRMPWDHQPGLSTDQCNRLRNLATRALPRPLPKGPKGEGWGEGEMVNPARGDTSLPKGEGWGEGEMVNPARADKDPREPNLPALVSQSLHSPSRMPWDHEPGLSADESNRLSNLATRALPLPLPKGEGWGEGEMVNQQRQPAVHAESGTSPYVP